MGRIYSKSHNFFVHAVATVALAVTVFNGPGAGSVTAAEHTVTPITVPRFLPPATGEPGPERPGSIRFVTSDDFPPFNFLDGGGRLTGFNVELARAICARLQVPCTMQVRGFPMLVDAVASNEADAIIAGLKDTPGLRRLVSYSRPYLRLPARFAVRGEARIEPVPETMAGRTVAVVSGTRYADYLADFFPATGRLETESLAEALAALSEGRADAVFDGALPLVFWLTGPEGSACCTLADGAWTEPAYFGRGLTIAVGRDNAPLWRAIDDALRALEADGVLADLHLRFFPRSLY